MSRSRKKTPCCHCAGHDGSWKKIYNRRLRRVPNIDMEQGVSTIPDGMYYRKMNCPWNISDLKCVGLSFEQTAEYPDGRDWYEKWYIRK